LDCLGDPAFASRLLAFACVLRPLRVLKSDIMGRSGEQWELEQQALSTSPGRSRRFPIEVAGDLEEVKIAQGDLKRLLGEGLKAPPLVGLCPRSTDESRAVEGFRLWRMCARAGAALQRYMAEELSRYPWRGLSALLGGREDVFVADANSCTSQCFMDEVCRAHWKRHPSLQDLRSPESQAKLLAIALQAQDNIGSIERQHAGARRGAAVHEQTWSDTTLFSSARHVLKHARAYAGGGSLGAVPAAEATGLPIGPKGSEAGGCDSQAAAQSSRKACQPEAPQPQRKRRRVDRFNGWTAVNVVGRLVDKADRQRYREAIRRPEIFAHYEHLAQDMTRARGREAECSLGKEARARLAHLQMRQAGRVALQREHEKAAVASAKSQQRMLQDKLPKWLLKETILVRGTLVSSQGALQDVQVHVWRPPETSVSAIEESFPGCMSRESGRVILEWEHRYAIFRW